MRDSPHVGIGFTEVSCRILETFGDVSVIPLVIWFCLLGTLCTHLLEICYGSTQQFVIVSRDGYRFLGCCPIPPTLNPCRDGVKDSPVAEQRSQVAAIPVFVAAKTLQRRHCSEDTAAKTEIADSCRSCQEPEPQWSE
jgi:hypothetical protein